MFSRSHKALWSNGHKRPVPGVESTFVDPWLRRCEAKCHRSAKIHQVSWPSLSNIFIMKQIHKESKVMDHHDHWHPFDYRGTSMAVWSWEHLKMWGGETAQEKTYLRKKPARKKDWQSKKKITRALERWSHQESLENARKLRRWRLRCAQSISEVGVSIMVMRYIIEVGVMSNNIMLMRYIEDGVF